MSLCESLSLFHLLKSSSYWITLCLVSVPRRRNFFFRLLAHIHESFSLLYPYYLFHFQYYFIFSVEVNPILLLGVILHLSFHSKILYLQFQLPCAYLCYSPHSRSHHTSFTLRFFSFSRFTQYIVVTIRIPWKMTKFVTCLNLYQKTVRSTHWLPISVLSVLTDWIMTFTKYDNKIIRVALSSVVVQEYCACDYSFNFSSFPSLLRPPLLFFSPSFLPWPGLVSPQVEMLGVQPTSVHIDHLAYFSWVL